MRRSGPELRPDQYRGAARRQGFEGVFVCQIVTKVSNDRPAAGLPDKCAHDISLVAADGAQLDVPPSKSYQLRSLPRPSSIHPLENLAANFGDLCVIEAAPVNTQDPRAYAHSGRRTSRLV